MASNTSVSLSSWTKIGIFDTLLSDLNTPSDLAIPALCAALVVIVGSVTLGYGYRRTTGASAGFKMGLNGAPRVSKILVHPIKSCRGTSVKRAKYDVSGLEIDRKWCIIDEQHKVYTAREIAKMVLIHPTVSFVDPEVPDVSTATLTVSFPDDSGCESFALPMAPSPALLDKWEVTTDMKFFHITLNGCVVPPSVTSSKGRPIHEVLTQFFGKPAYLVYQGAPRICDPTASHPDLKVPIAYTDGYPLLFLSEESVDSVQADIRGFVGKQGVEQRWEKEQLVIERFRPNIVLQGGGAFAEDTWEEICVGTQDAKFSLVSKCTRCLLPNVAPDTGIRDAAVPFKVLMKTRTGIDPKLKNKACMGCNGVPHGSGEIQVGDFVSVLKYATV